MQKQTQTKQSAQLNIQENAENSHKENYPLNEREPIPGTPFTLIKYKNAWFMVMGDYRITEDTKTKKEQIDKLDTEKWLLIMHICIIAVERMQKSNKDFQQYQENIHKIETNYETESL